MQHGPLPEFVAASLAAHAAPLARHWLERAAAATPRPPAGQAAPSTASSGTDRDASAVNAAEQVVRALAESVRGTPTGAVDAQPDVPVTDRSAARLQDARPAADVMRLGWAAGGAAYAAGHSVHHVGRDANLLLAVVLADVERAAAQVPPGPGAGAAEGVAVARRLQRAVARYGQAALSGFVHALLRGLRERYRLLRHDLRNPLGTIRSAVSLMEDESVPVETRQSPNIRAMVARNAGSLDRLIARRLDDAAAVALLAPPYAVSVRDVALAARREVRDAARLAGCDVVVDVPPGAPSRVDGAALELTLTTVLLAALARASAGDRVRVQCVDRADLRAAHDPDAATAGGSDEDHGAEDQGATCLVLGVDLASADGRASYCDDGLGPCWDEAGLELALALAGDHGGRLGVDASVAPVQDAAALVAALARTPVVYLRLPLLEPGAADGAAVRQTAGAGAESAAG